MKKIKVMTVVGTRPEIVRLSRVICLLEIHTEHVLVHTGQNYDYELSKIFFEELGIKEPDYYLDASEDSVAATIGNVIKNIDPILENEKPDAFLVLGDTNSCLSVIAAKRRKVPIFHMEAGNRCFDERVPEEINRKIIDHISDINLPYSHIAREYLVREGIPPDRIIKTGSPMLEVLEHYKDRIQKSTIIEDLGLEANNYFLVSSHREENVDSEESLTKLLNILNSLASTYKKRIIVSTHPRTKRRIDEIGAKLDDLVELRKPMGYFSYIKLQQNAFAVLSDSGTITEESSLLGFPALNIREAHERPEGMEEAAVMMTGFSIERIYQGLSILADPATKLTRHVDDYQVVDVSSKVLKIILSYIDYVKRNSWFIG